MKTVVIKKYDNRKLYNTEISAYVTLTDILKLVRDGQEIMILDNSSKRDVTNEVLHRAIFENEQRNGFFDRETLVASIKQNFINGRLV